MTATTHPEFNENTEALDVAKAFPDRIHGKTILVTGVNPKGIGFTTAEAFASQSPAHLIVAGRTLSKLQETITTLKHDYPNVDCRPLQLDLSSQAAVRKAATELMAWADVPHVDIVVNSAGIMNLPERTLNVDGIEMTFGTNHIGHFLFTNLIMPKLIAAAKTQPKGAVRVVNVSSLSPTVTKSMRWSDLNFEKINNTLPEIEQPAYDMAKAWGNTDPETKSYLPLEGYNQSKVANVLFGIGLTDKCYEKYGILGLAIHPGVIYTELGRSFAPETLAAMEGMHEKGRFSFRTPGAGSSTSLVAAVDPKLSKMEGASNLGCFLLDCQISDACTPNAKSSSEADRLWKVSEGLVGQMFNL